MNKKKQDAIKKYKDACNLLASIVNDQLFEGCRDWYWLGDEVGGLCDFLDTDFISPEEMVRNNRGFCGYGWMVDSIIHNDEIKYK